MTLVSLPFAVPGRYTSSMNFLSSLLSDEEGQDLIEYTLVMAFIALACAGIFTNAGNSAKSIWKNASNQLSNAVIASS